MDWNDYYKEVEKYARHLCELDGKDPEDYYEEFDRDASAWNTHNEDEVEIFRKVYLWTEYESEAHRAVTYFKGDVE